MLVNESNLKAGRSMQPTSASEGKLTLNMNRLETIAMHAELVSQRKRIASREVGWGDSEGRDIQTAQLKDIDQAISRYGQVYNDRIAAKAAQWLAIQ